MIDSPSAPRHAGRTGRVGAEELGRRIDQALGREPADLAIRGGSVLDLVFGSVERSDVALTGAVIAGVGEGYRGREEIDATGLVVVPGFIDTHVHVESTMVTPAEFDRCVLPRGTTTAVCDPHEIANVLGEEGLRYFLEAAGSTAMDLRVQLSSCVPATHLETSGARLSAEDLAVHRDHPAVIGLAEFMNFPGVLGKDPEALAKLAAFSDGHIDGHCPLVTGRDLDAYAACGVRNCHESTSATEAREKLKKGMQVLIREGSVSKDVAALAELIDARTAPFLAFCTDDRNPLDIAEEGHIDYLIRKAIGLGAPIVDVYRAASWAAARAFGIDRTGLVAPGYCADLVLLEDLEFCAVRAVVKDGRLVGPETFAGRPAPAEVGRDSIWLDPVSPDDLRVPGSTGTCSVIGIIPGSILTEHLRLDLEADAGELRGSPEEDILKVAVFSRHGTNRNVGRGFVRGFGLNAGALGSSVGHDSHNVIVVGTNDSDMAAAVNRLIDREGGFVATRDGNVVADLPLPLAGLISDRPFEEVRDRLKILRSAVSGLGSDLAEPMLQLAFLPLPVIPHLKITDMGLVDVDRFALLG